jgi:poly-gamma-glutamate synthesis protein (capsule biosynthesis protein)
LAHIHRHADGRVEAGFIPVHVEPPGRPVLADEDQSRIIAEYIGRITQAAGLPALTMRRQDGIVIVV